MINLSENFTAAIKDYHAFLSNWYPQKAVLKLVGDRYKLSGTERSILYRGVALDKEISLRLNKLVHTCNCSGSILHIDAFNQLLTVTSYLNGSVVFISNDDLLRDAAEIHGSHIPDDLLERSIDLVFQYLENVKAGHVIFYLDQQLTNHSSATEVIRSKAKNNTFQTEIKISDSVDKLLKNADSGLLATSDSQIVDKSKLKNFDLAFHTLKFHFNPSFIDLNSFLD